MNAIAKKLLIKPGQRWLFYNAPLSYVSLLESLPDGVEPTFEPGGTVDGIQLFVTNKDELGVSLQALLPSIKDNTTCWITYPKKSSGIKSDLEMMGNWDVLTNQGFGIVASAAIDSTWTALRFKKQQLISNSVIRNDNIRVNEYSAYIDVDNKTVTLPADMKRILDGSAAAMSFFKSLSYSYKKEYVVWILSAKQEKTKAERLEKLLEKMENRKKNPSEK